MEKGWEGVGVGGMERRTKVQGWSFSNVQTEDINFPVYL